MLETGEPGQYLLQQSRGLAESIEFRYLDTRECSVFILCTISLVDIVEMRVSAHLSVEKIRKFPGILSPRAAILTDQISRFRIVNAACRGGIMQSPARISSTVSNCMAFRSSSHVNGWL